MIFALVLLELVVVVVVTVSPGFYYWSHSYLNCFKGVSNTVFFF